MFSGRRTDFTARSGAGQLATLAVITRDNPTRAEVLRYSGAGVSNVLLLFRVGNIDGRPQPAQFIFGWDV